MEAQSSRRVRPFTGGQLVAQMRVPRALAPDVIFEPADKPVADFFNHAPASDVGLEARHVDLVQPERLEAPPSRRGCGLGHQPLAPKRERDPVTELGAIVAHRAYAPRDAV